MAGRLLRYRYDLEARLAEGGLFEAWKGTDRVRSAPVVAKLLHGREASDQNLARAWVRRLNAQRAETLPGSTALVEAVREDDGVLLVREYAEGVPLERWMTRPRRFDEALACTVALLRLLAQWHAAGQAHGFLHPGNVVLAAHGPVLCDRDVAAATAEIFGLRSTRSTQEVYLAPEVRAGRAPVPGSDVFSVGVVLWELVTGRRLMPGTVPVRPSHINPHLPASVDVVIEGMLKPDPEERYPATQAAEALARLRERTEPAARPKGQGEADAPLPRKPLPRLVTAILWSYRLLFMLLGTLVVSAGTLAGMGYGTYRYLLETRPAEVIIPDVAGMPKDKAKELFEQNLQLGFSVSLTQPHRSVPPNAVILTDPGPGRKVRAGRLVKAIVSTGPALVTVPKIDHITIADAQAQLQRSGLRVGKVEKTRQEDVPAGYVVKQEPAAATRVDAGTVVNLWVSFGAVPEETTRPKSRGKDGETVDKRAGRVRIACPADPALSWVRIVVRDDDGDHVVYNELHKAGDVIEKRVEGVGQTVVEVYINDTPVEKKVL